MSVRIGVKEILDIINRYGGQHQLYKAAEELSELQTVVLQDANKEIISKASVAEEIADVYITVKQIELIYGLDDRDIQPIIDYKLNRVEERIHNEGEIRNLRNRANWKGFSDYLERENW